MEKLLLNRLILIRGISTRDLDILVKDAAQRSEDGDIVVQCNFDFEIEVFNPAIDNFHMEGIEALFWLINEELNK